MNSKQVYTVDVLIIKINNKDKKLGIYSEYKTIQIYQQTETT